MVLHCLIGKVQMASPAMQGPDCNESLVCLDFPCLNDKNLLHQPNALAQARDCASPGYPWDISSPLVERPLAHPSGLRSHFTFP